MLRQGNPIYNPFAIRHGEYFTDIDSSDPHTNLKVKLHLFFFTNQCFWKLALGHWSRLSIRTSRNCVSSDRSFLALVRVLAVAHHICLKGETWEKSIRLCDVTESRGLFMTPIGMRASCQPIIEPSITQARRSWWHCRLMTEGRYNYTFLYFSMVEAWTAP